MAIQIPINPPITTFFTNKIPSTFDDWFETLVAVATIYNKFDGMPYNRELIIEEFKAIASRSTTTSRDPADFRDEYGAYGSYLGIFYVEKDLNGMLVCRVSRAAKELLCGHEPDPEAFCRIQMALYQYPDGMGVSFIPKPRIQSNSADAKIMQIQSGVLFSPFRTILNLLLYLKDNHGESNSFLTYSEIYFLFNNPMIYKGKLNLIPNATKLLLKKRKNNSILQEPESNFKRNFHILERTGLIKRDCDRLVLNLQQFSDRKLRAARTIAGMDCFYKDFSRVSGNIKEMRRSIRDIILTGSWGRYFDGMELNYDTIEAIINTGMESQESGIEKALFPAPKKYRLFRFPGSSVRPGSGPPDYAKANAVREKRNLRHRQINDMLAKKILGMGLTALDNNFADLITKINQKDFIIEVKTCGESDLLVRVRDGVAQLLEYKFRSRETLSDPVLALLLERKPPVEYNWIKEYLDQLGIILCWISEDKIWTSMEKRNLLNGLIDEYL